ncbi:MAG: RsbRD N-terminal domain-containing protein [Desulfovibrionaceae bacterium]
MTLLDQLRDQREQLADAWLQSVFKTYPIDTVGFLRSKKDQFANPVGNRTTKAIRVLTDELLKDGLDTEAVQEPLDELIRIRTIQDFTPAAACGVIYFLKTIVRDLMAKTPLTPELMTELLQFESKLDTLALISFNIYIKCKTLVYEMRIKEVKLAQHRLLQRAGMICGTAAEDEPDTNPN